MQVFLVELLLSFGAHGCSVLLVAAIKDKVVGVGVRCAMKNRDLVFHTHVQMPILEGTFSCKRLYNFVSSHFFFITERFCVEDLL